MLWKSSGVHVFRLIHVWLRTRSRSRERKKERRPTDKKCIHKIMHINEIYILVTGDCVALCEHSITNSNLLYISFCHFTFLLLFTAHSLWLCGFNFSFFFGAQMKVESFSISIQSEKNLPMCEWRGHARAQTPIILYDKKCVHKFLAIIIIIIDWIESNRIVRFTFCVCAATIRSWESVLIEQTEQTIATTTNDDAKNNNTTQRAEIKRSNIFRILFGAVLKYLNSRHPTFHLTDSVSCMLEDFIMLFPSQITKDFNAVAVVFIFGFYDWNQTHHRFFITLHTQKTDEKTEKMRVKIVIAELTHFIRQFQQTINDIAILSLSRCLSMFDVVCFYFWLNRFNWFSAGHALLSINKQNNFRSCSVNCTTFIAL